jgi:hypothetical protein
MPDAKPEEMMTPFLFPFVMLSVSTKTLSGPGINDSAIDANKKDSNNSISISIFYLSNQVFI